MNRMSPHAKVDGHFKYQHLVAVLKDRITSGYWPIGSRLPSRDRLQEDFSISRATLQRAMNELIRDGFVTASGKAGTCVSDTPPFVSQYGLALPAQEEQSAFVRILHRQAGLMETDDRRIEVYTNVDLHVEGGQRQRLLEDIAEHRLAGLIAGSLDLAAPESPLAGRSDFPMVVLAPHTTCGEPTVYPDLDSFFRQAVARLAQSGRRNVALVSYPFNEHLHLAQQKDLAPILAAAGMRTRPQWHLAGQPGASFALRHAVQLLMNQPPKDRPDSIIVSDDNLVPDATAGLLASGVSVPEDVEVVAHCNFPEPTLAAVPVHRIGFDAREILNRCIQVLGRARAEGQRCESIKVQAVTESQALSVSRFR